MIRTKIVATMGPACGKSDGLFRLFEAGVDVCRLNFSHGSLDDHLLMLRHIREAAARWNQPIAVLGDLCGPKIRLGKIADHGGAGGMLVNIGDEIVCQRDTIVGSAGRVCTIYDRFVDDVKIGDRILVEDGLVRFVCTDKGDHELRWACTTGGMLRSNKGINLPNTTVHVPSITDRDWQCAQWAIENDLDYLALSFVRKADDIQQLRRFLTERSSDMQIIAKIEKAEAIAEIDAILEAADGLMVARGDLGVEMDIADVPIIQKDLIRRCQTIGKPVIVATQMLQSMIDVPSPTRAEVSDVANAIFDGTDAVMLSGETSVGKFPHGAVHMMSHVAETTEAYLTSTDTGRESPLRLKATVLSAAVARGVRQIVQDLKAELVVIWSQTGASARIFSKTRFPVPIIAISSDHRALRRMALHYGLVPREMAPPADVGQFIAEVDSLILEQKFASVGSRIVMAAGTSLGSPRLLNGIIIHTVGQAWESAEAPPEFPRLASGTEQR
jgi:pyruvate kinase